MLKNKLDKKTPELSLSFDNILVCNEKKSKPFIEIVVQEGENVEQQNLGTLIGIFEVSDNSEDSSYIVNYLISVIRKEYFSRPKRGPIESFEAALHKANLALSKLAEHGNISWIGKLNIICAVFEKNKLHLSKSGTACAFLFRSKTLTDISEGLSEIEAEPNPLKTFDNVSSGKLEIGDKLIIATDNIFEIFSLEEIKKSILRFSHSELVQFLNTALTNELDRAAALLVNIKEKLPEPKIASPRKPSSSINVFSQTAFTKPTAKLAEKISESIKMEIKEELKKTKEEFSDKKTGHIYIKGSDHPVAERDYFSDALFILRDFSRTIYEKAAFLSKKFFGNLRKYLSRLKEGYQKMEMAFPKEKVKAWIFSIKEKLKVYFQSVKPSSQNQPAAISSESFTVKSEENRWRPNLNWLPSFRGLRESLSGLSYEQRLYAILIVLGIIVFPYFGLNIIKKISERNKPSATQEFVPAAIPLEQDKNVSRISQTDSLYSGSGILGITDLNEKMFAATSSEIIDLESGEKFPFPGDFGQAEIMAGMNDLNLVFVLNKDRKVVAFSSVSKKFQNNNIDIPENSRVSDVKTYLTYIYFLDSQNNQIYRYPRAEGGFGNKTDWIKDSVLFSDTTGMAINENIFVVDSKSVTKLFRGEKQDFNMEQSTTPIIPYKIYTSENSSSIYVLDRSNARIIKLDEAGNIIYQYYNAEMGEANDFSIDEENNIAYFSTAGNIKSFKME